MAEQKKLISVVEVPPLKGKTDAEIEALAQQMADKFAEDMAAAGEEVVRREDIAANEEPAEG